MSDKNQNIRTIAVTGGAGFIGRRLVSALRDDGHEVRVIDTADPQAPVDITDPAALSSALQGVDAVYHLAAEHRDDVRPVSRYYEVNEQGTQNLIQVAEECGIQEILFTSTVAVYGLNAAEADEQTPPDPFNDYGHSKRAAEKLLQDWAAQDRTRRLLIMRLVATFGPGNRGNIHTLMDQIRRGRFVQIGAGNNRKSVAYVENVAAFLKHALNLPAGRHLYNYADKPDWRMAELVRFLRGSFGLKRRGMRLPYSLGLAGGMVFDTLASVTGRRFPISAVRVRKFCADTVVNAGKLHAETGFTPPYTLEEGLQAMIDSDFRDRDRV